MAFTKITPEDRQGKGNVGQPDTPLLTTTEMQEQMDSLANLAIDKFNNHIDEISSQLGANNVGMEVPDGITALPSVGSILDAVASEMALAIRDRHIHNNKSVLDTLTADYMASINTIVIMLSGIVAVESTLTDDNTHIPTSAAVVNYITNYNYKSIIKNALYPLGSVYTTTLMAPDSVFGTTDEWQLIKTDADGIKYYKRIA